MNEDLQHLLRIARLAGDEIIDVYSGEIAVEQKADNSPLTEADHRANSVIVSELRAQWTNVPILSEESKAVRFEERKGWREFWLVDPLDGTKEFIKRNGEFTVNIALVRDGVPIIGLVYQPTEAVAYMAQQGNGAFRVNGTDEKVRLTRGAHYSELNTVRVVASRSHMSEAVADFVESLENEGKRVRLESSGSSLKICRVAEGTADVYPRLGPTMEWDTAAAHVVAVEAGRAVLQWESRAPLCYNKEDLLNPWFIVE